MLFRLLFLVLCIILCLKNVYTTVDDKLSPFNQYLPNCNEGFARITKKTQAKALLCPMIK
jgi:hypothetical protein